MSRVKTTKTDKKKSMVKDRPSSAVMGFAVIAIGFLLTTDAYYIWQLVRL